MKVKEESEKAGFLTLNIQNTKIMASGPIASQQIDGETMETVTDFIFLSFKITEDSDCSHEIKGHLLLGRKAMRNLGSILKSRDREVGGGIGMGNTCKPMVVSFQCMTKFTTNKKNKIKIK